MSLVITCRQPLYKLSVERSFTVNHEGRIFKLLSPMLYKTQLLKCMALIIVGFMAHIIRGFQYYPVTIVANTIYARVAAACLSRNKIPFVLCRGNNRIPYYETEDGREIAFEGPSVQYFANTYDESIPLIPHSEAELKQLEAHTKLENLHDIQQHILRTFPNKDGVPIAAPRDLIPSPDIKLKAPIVAIKHFFGNLYYIMSMNEVWISRIVLTDNVIALQPGDSILELNGMISSETHDTYEIRHGSTSCTIQEMTKTTTLTRESNYIVDNDLCIRSTKLMDEPNNYPGIIYSLTSPRPLVQNSLHITHPFHFPATWDPFLTIMIVTLGIILK